MDSLFDGVRVDEPIEFQLKALVLDYLAHQGYTNTVAAIVRDSEGDNISDGDNTRTLHRRLVYHNLQAGNIEHAIALLNSHFPQVLHQLKNPDPPHHRRISDAITYSCPTHPHHLALNLRIQAFIEACRTRPLPFPPPDDNHIHTDQPTLDLNASILLLNKAKKLLAHAQMLPNPADRALYSRELNNVGGLLAYQVPENSPIRKYMAQDRRDAVADQIHCAILEHAGICSISSLELLVRYTANLWYFANKLEIKPRPGAIVPPTPLPPLLDIVPMFDLGEFLDHKP
ncbi:hypothetical protein C0991_003905 [Blastosporella zonata]|nr:hypothetical protein C0991_003905 [Blastosporella zonata]